MATVFVASYALNSTSPELMNPIAPIDADVVEAAFTGQMLKVAETLFTVEMPPVYGVTASWIPLGVVATTVCPEPAGAR